MSQYPDEVVVLATDPVKGIASTCKFRPSVAEINTCCEKWAQIIWARDHADEIAAQEEAERQAKLAAEAETQRLLKFIHELEHGKPAPELSDAEKQANRERYGKIMRDAQRGEFSQ